MKRRNVLKSLFTLPAALLAPSSLRGKSEAKTKNILLADTSIAGFRYYQGEEVWHRMKSGGDLQLRREPKNPFDYDAVEVYLGRDKIGYIPRAYNSPIAQMMDRGMTLKSKIRRLSRSEHSSERVGITVEIIV